MRTGADDTQDGAGRYGDSWVEPTGRKFSPGYTRRRRQAAASVPVDAWGVMTCSVLAGRVLGILSPLKIKADLPLPVARK